MIELQRFNIEDIYCLPRSSCNQIIFKFYRQRHFAPRNSSRIRESKNLKYKHEAMKACIKTNKKVPSMNLANFPFNSISVHLFQGAATSSS